MAKLTKSQREWRPGMKKKARSTKVMFASTVLLCEAFLAIFVTLAAYGLKRADPMVLLVLGGAVAVLCIFTCAILRKPGGYLIGWILQLVFFLSGFILPDMFYLSALFALCWWYALKKGGEIDVENKRRAVAQEAWERKNPEQV